MRHLLIVVGVACALAGCQTQVQAPAVAPAPPQWQAHSVGGLTVEVPAEWKVATSPTPGVFELRAPTTIDTGYTLQTWGLTIHTVQPPEGVTPEEDVRARAGAGDEAPDWRTAALRTVAGVECGFVQTHPPDHEVWNRSYYFATPEGVLVVNVSYPAAEWPGIEERLLAPIEARFMRAIQ